MTRSEREQSAWECGYDDHNIGYDVEDNPYYLISEWESNAWRRGWNQAAADSADGTYDNNYTQL
jgi:hypothetical protein